MKAATVLGLAFLIAILVFFLPRTIEEYNVMRSQETVIVEVTKLSDCSSGYKHKFIHFVYNGKTYISRTKCKYIKSLVVGQQLTMVHKTGNDIFLFPTEDVTSELLATISLAILMTVCVGVFLWKQMKARQNAHNKGFGKMRADGTFSSTVVF